MADLSLEDDGNATGNRPGGALSPLSAWRERWSDADAAGLEVVLRLEGLAGLAGAEPAEALAAAGVSRASFDVLIALRLADGEELSQRALVRRVGRTPGTMSVRLGRLATAASSSALRGAPSAAAAASR